MKKKGFLGKVTSHAVALFLGVILTFSTIRVMSSQADTIPSNKIPNSSSLALETQPELQAQAPVASNSSSFVAAAVAKTGAAVVRIDTERTVATQMDPFFEDPFFREFFGDSLWRKNTQRKTGSRAGFGLYYPKRWDCLY